LNSHWRHRREEALYNGRFKEGKFMAAGSDAKKATNFHFALSAEEGLEIRRMQLK